jgi:hypothetical protein
MGLKNMEKFIRQINNRTICTVEIDGENITHMIYDRVNYKLPVKKTIFQTIDNLLKALKENGYVKVV